VTKADVRALTRAEAMEIYRKNYWNAVGGDSLPRGVDLAVWDYGVNSGPSRGRAAYAKARGAGAPAEIVKRVCALRRSFVQGLRTWSTFGKGWSARIAACEALGVKMALAAAGLSPGTISGSLHTEAKEAAKTATKKSKQAGGSAAGAAVTPSAPAAGGADWEVWIFAGIVIVVLAGVAFMLWKSAQDEKERAKAFTLEAEAI
jgi:lysozyme family protein